MLNQLISEQNKTYKKRSRIEDVCNNIIKGLDEEITNNKKSYIPSLIEQKKVEKPSSLSKTQKFIKELATNKLKNSVYMTNQDIKNSKRIQNLFKANIPKKKPIMTQVS